MIAAFDIQRRQQVGIGVQSGEAAVAEPAAHGDGAARRRSCRTCAGSCARLGLDSHGPDSARGHHPAAARAREDAQGDGAKQPRSFSASSIDARSEGGRETPRGRGEPAVAAHGARTSRGAHEWDSAEPACRAQGDRRHATRNWTGKDCSAPARGRHRGTQYPADRCNACPYSGARESCTDRCGACWYLIRMLDTVQAVRTCAGFAWGHSSAGRALAWHARGRRFDPAWLHQFRVTRDLSPVSPSSRGLGHRPFTAVTGVRIPLGTPINSIAYGEATEITPKMGNLWGIRRDVRHGSRLGSPSCEIKKNPPRRRLAVKQASSRIVLAT